MTDYSSEDFWKGAPEGATHYNAAQGNAARLFSWMKVEAGLCLWHYYDFNLRRWVRQHDFPIVSDVLVARPTPPWSGDGLPPAGTVCEFKEHARDSWAECTIIGEFRGRIICGCHKTGAVGYIDLGELRPIKTPAQIAAEEREAGIQKMLLAVNPVGHLPGYAYQVVSCLYDAGLRFPKGDDQ